MLPFRLLFVLVVVVWVARGSGDTIATCFDNMPSAAAPLFDELPLCGNGVLDAGELCDDGNRVAGDGCNAFCSAFDAMPSACTLAGQSMSCPFGKPQVAAPSQSLFCNLRAIDAGPDGTYVILADMGSLFRYNLYVDNLASSITRFSASATFSIQPICSLAVLPSDGTIMLHECDNQRVRLVSANGQTATVLADFRTTLKPNSPFRAYYDKSSGEAVIAANLLQPSTCTQIWTVTSGGVSALLADIPCIVYNVWSAGIIYPSYSIVGMNPRSISKELCPRRMQQTGSAYCYSLAMQRDDMYIFYVFVHVEGGVDMAYQLNTNTLDNALGLPITRVLGSQVYTALGACLTMESRILTSRGSTPPTVTLGNACRNVPFSGLPCATPLNNPYITDVASSPYLLPQGLSATHTHSELSAIFSATCPSSQANSSGPLLYRSILQNVYGNTTPVDFVPLPNTQDIVYITSTTVGFISSKRTQLLDRLNHGYCRPNNLLYCPHGYFGSVGSVCASCTDSRHPMYGKSVAWQIKCASLQPSSVNGTNRRLLLQTRSSPFEKMSLIVGADPKDPTVLPVIHEALKAYTATKAVAAPSLSETFLTSMQQYNMAADRWTSFVSSSTQTLIECLILNAENTTRRVLNKNKTTAEGAEFISTLLSYTPGQPLITSIFQPIVQRTNDTFASKCSESFLYKDPLQAWLPCVTLRTTTASPHTARRLLQQTGATTTGVLIVEHQSTILASSTAVSWSAETQNTPLPPPPSMTTTPPPSTSSTTDAFPIWAAATVAGVGLVIVLFLVYLLYRYLSPSKKHSS